ncbi:hypothetical protein [Billgrantia saliphila]|uniref:hypothetical protein n=1 Tax=Billgrantia saliphila TaxID=1848458 RepID=UPI000CE54F55|nr:hypothetical protein [Halomonas saliphila]
MTQAKRTWWSRLCEGSYRASTRRLVREIETEAPQVYSEILQDLETPLESAFERELAQHLDHGGYRAFVPAETLLPAMRQRFGLDEVRVAEPGLASRLRGTCNACPVAGHCWRALRHGAEVDECRGFCPNAEALEREQLAC